MHDCHSTGHSHHLLHPFAEIWALTWSYTYQRIGRPAANRSWQRRGQAVRRWIGVSMACMLATFLHLLHDSGIRCSQHSEVLRGGGQRWSDARASHDFVPASRGSGASGDADRMAKSAAQPQSPALDDRATGAAGSTLLRVHQRVSVVLDSGTCRRVLRGSALGAAGEAVHDPQLPGRTAGLLFLREHPRIWLG